MDNEKKTVGKEFLSKLDKILKLVCTSNKKLDTLYRQHTELYEMLRGFYKFNIKSQIPYMTPKQLVALQSRNWSIQELSNISGYSVEEVQKKISNYKNV